MPEFKITGIVLKSSAYAEADRIYRIFTRELGLVSALGKGVKKLTSKKSGALEIFHVVNLRLHRRTGELFLIIGASGNTEILNTKYQILDTNLSQLAIAYELSEWLLALTPAEKPLPKVYALTLEIFAWLTKTPKLKLLTLAFKTKLLHLLGYLHEHAEDTWTHKLLRFMITAELSKILRVETDAETFTRVEKILDTIFTNLVEKESHVKKVVANWSSTSS